MSREVYVHFPTSEALERSLAHPPAADVYLVLHQAWDIDAGDYEVMMPEPSRHEWHYDAALYTDLLFSAACFADEEGDVLSSARAIVCFYAPFSISVAAPTIWDCPGPRAYRIAGQLLSVETVRRLLAIYETIDWDRLRSVENAMAREPRKVAWSGCDPAELFPSVDVFKDYLGEYVKFCRHALELNRFLYITSH